MQKKQSFLLTDTAEAFEDAEADPFPLLPAWALAFADELEFPPADALAFALAVALSPSATADAWAFAADLEFP